MAKDNHPILTLNPEQRLTETLKLIEQNKQIWILTDQHGCVMLNTEDEEDGVPVWPESELAELWATDEWADCEPLSITLEDWIKKWQPGLAEDNLLVMVCPLPGEEGEVLSPEEFSAQLG
ncbi:DUF2750 domain-containing protein [Alteromonas sp. ASW11-130]|uniref:DUF2750 domain-containing protein n=1 Tax=Alteromonas sp. ASW11-130 TaxID=3015775 RepID=UPI002242B031|nr:DUF2750 domain-containing protein [Alteromonas sp. ASW11-130]MCW8090267.1 DUF2750 domain-containing protein [Alteromonas sp. ASW11-130]